MTPPGGCKEFLTPTVGGPAVHVKNLLHIWPRGRDARHGARGLSSPDESPAIRARRASGAFGARPRPNDRRTPKPRDRAIQRQPGERADAADRSIRIRQITASDHGSGLPKRCAVIVTDCSW